MGIFSKERHGSFDVVTPGYDYVWKIPNIRTHVNAILDSPIHRCYTGVDFHFHMTITHDGQVSFYMHYKDTPIPKYTYSMGCAGGTLPRQHTAFRIPSHTERCGHCNVLNIAEVYKLMEGSSTSVVKGTKGRDQRGSESGGSSSGSGVDGVLYVYFSWDRDTLHVSRAPEAELVVRWTVPDVANARLTPLTSKGFALNNSVFALRLDEASDGAAVILFIFAKEGVITPHRLELMKADGSVVAELEPVCEPGARILKLPKLEFLRHFPQPQAMHVVVKFLRYNPLEFLNSAEDAKKKLKVQPVDRVVELGGRESGKSYIVMEDDV